MLVRDLDPEVVERLKARARAHGRSQQKEVKSNLEEAASTLSTREAAEVAESWQRRLAGREHSNSAELLREDRER